MMTFLQEIFLGIVNMSITASLVIGVVLILRLVLARAPKRYSYLLWGIVLFRLLCPVSLPSDFSALDLVEGQTTEEGRVEYFSENQEEISESVTILPAGKEGSSSIRPVQTVQSFRQRMQPYLASAWLLGIAVMAIYSIATMLRLRRRVECSVPLQKNIYLADHIPTPFVLGVLRPRIYLPSGLEEKEREYILLHEQYHIRRRDYLVKPLAFLALCLHWFNPLVWLAFVLAGRDMEMSCDEAVMGKIKGDVRKAYASSLLHLSTGKRAIAVTPLAFGEGNPKKRIKNVMRYQKPVFLLGVAAVIILLAASACLMTNPSSVRPSQKWVQDLKAGDVESIEAAVTPQGPEQENRYLSEDEIDSLVAELPGFLGNYVEDHNEVEGSSIFLVFTMKDGITHEVVNIGNTYLCIDEDFYEIKDDGFHIAPAGPGEGNGRSLQDILGTVEDQAYVEFQARIIEIAEGTMLVEPVEGDQESKSSDRISVPIRNMEPSPEPQVGDLVEIRYDGTIMESYPAQLGEVYQIRVLKEADTSPQAFSPEEQAIVDAIMEYNADDERDADFSCCSFAKLGTSPDASQEPGGRQIITYYGWALYQEYNLSPEGIEDVGGSHLPVALTFAVEGEEYTLQEYWRPREGSYFDDDVREKFPAELAEDGFDSQKTIVAQIQNCYAQVVSGTDLDVDRVIEGLLRQICTEEPQVSSNPQDYIEAHRVAYRELGYYGDYTIRYCLKRFEKGGETGLEGQIMARICQELLEVEEDQVPEGAANGQEWYEAMKAHAGNVLEGF